MKRVDKRSVVDQAIAEVREVILSARFEPGDRLEETVLANELGISRASLREAFYHLTGEGLVERRAHRGTFLRAFDDEAARNLFIVRMALEPLAARLAARRMSPGTVAELESLLSASAQPAPGDLDMTQTVRLDSKLHIAVAKASGNETLVEIMKMLSSQIHLLVRQTGPTVYSDRGPEEIVADHRVIIAALKANDADAAESLVRDHIRHAARRVIGGDWEDLTEALVAVAGERP